MAIIPVEHDDALNPHAGNGFGITVFGCAVSPPATVKIQHTSPRIQPNFAIEIYKRNENNQVDFFIATY